MSLPEPAHDTKHVPSLSYTHLGHTFHLKQSDDGHSTGTTLWLGAQVLAAYLQCHQKPTQARLRAVELGSGIGLTALVLSALGYDVLATDMPHVCNSVLRHNIAANLPLLPATAGRIQVRELDWTVEGDRLRLRQDPSRSCDASTECGTKFDLIISSDTLYDVSLVDPFFHTVRALAAIDPLHPPLFLLALERRDPEFIESALARSPVPLARVPAKRVRKAMVRVGIRWEWDSVEIWKGRLVSGH